MFVGVDTELTSDFLLGGDLLHAEVRHNACCTDSCLFIASVETRH